MVLELGTRDMDAVRTCLIRRERRRGVGLYWCENRQAWDVAFECNAEGPEAAHALVFHDAREIGAEKLD